MEIAKKNIYIHDLVPIINSNVKARHKINILFPAKMLLFHLLMKLNGARPTFSLLTCCWRSAVSDTLLSRPWNSSRILERHSSGRQRAPFLCSRVVFSGESSWPTGSDTKWNMRQKWVFDALIETAARVPDCARRSHLFPLGGVRSIRTASLLLTSISQNFDANLHKPRLAWCRHVRSGLTLAVKVKTSCW